VVQWIEGHSYAYSQDIPYFPLVDLLNRLLQIDEKDSLSKVREKVEKGLESLVGKNADVTPYVGGLYSLRYPQTEAVSPEYWKTRLQDAILKIFSALAEKSPTVVFIEDLHWADPSFVDLLRRACLEIRQPILLLCAYRPIFSLFTGHILNNLGVYYQEIKLENFSLSVAQHMLSSLLKTKIIPPDLKRWVNSKAEGNPFYIEELINSLIESEILISDSGKWELTRPLTESIIPASLRGLINGRLDRLEKQTKRILQEASVIGRDFLYDILKKITELKEHIDVELHQLERFDLIRTRSLQPEIEYMFKHALTQEVAYKSLLKKERQVIHDQIGLVMETMFQDRLPEFYETLALHYKQSKSIDKAIDYLTKAGDKCLKKYAVEESHQYFKDAFSVLSTKLKKTNNEEKQIVNILLKWAYVFNHRGDFIGLSDLLINHEKIAESLNEKEYLGMFCAWIGLALFGREHLKTAYKYLHRALNLGKEANSYKVIGYSCAWLTMNCSALGFLDEALFNARTALEAYKFVHPDKELYRFAMVGMGMAYWFRGECNNTIDTGEKLKEFGQREFDLRCTTMGHWTIGNGHYAAGNFYLAIKFYKMAIQVAPDPLFASAGKFSLGMALMANRQLKDSEQIFMEVMQYAESGDAAIVGTASKFFHGIITMMNGNLYQGTRIVEDLLELWDKNCSKYRYILGSLMLGKLFLKIVQGSDRKSISFLFKNFRFLLTNVPFADKKAEKHFKTVIKIANDINAKSLLGQAKFDLAMLHIAKNRTVHAREYLSSAIQIFEECKAVTYLQQAKEVMASLG
jgi:tetratricopeptide (TPR) repeat protein